MPCVRSFGAKEPAAVPTAPVTPLPVWRYPIRRYRICGQKGAEASGELIPWRVVTFSADKRKIDHIIGRKKSNFC